MNFYNWIRDGVRRAVLLGVSDAIEQIGPPSESDPMSQHLLTMLRQGPAIETQPAAPVAQRKRLGRSLEQITRDANTAVADRPAG